MDNQQYNKHLIDFYSDAYLQFFLRQQNNKELVHGETMKVWSSFSENFNDFFAFQFLNDLAAKFPSINDKFVYYPEQYWLTPHGKRNIAHIILNTVNMMSEKIRLSIEDSEKPGDDFFRDFLTNLFHLHKKNKDYFFSVIQKLYPVLISFENKKNKFNYTKIFIEQISQEAEKSLDKNFTKDIYLFLNNTVQLLPHDHPHFT